MPAPPGDPPRAPQPPRPTSAVNQAAAAAREQRRTQRQIDGTGSRSASAGSTFVITATTGGTGLITIGPIDASDYDGFVLVTATVSLGGTPPAGTLRIIANDGISGGAFPNATTAIDIGCSTAGIQNGSTAVVEASFTPDDGMADLSALTLNLTIRSKVLPT